MRFETFLPGEQLRPFVRQYAISENAQGSDYKILPSQGMVIGFQYRGQLSVLHAGMEQNLAASGITGISDSYKVFRNSAGIGTVLVYFSEVGFTHFSSVPASELFNLSLALEAIFGQHAIREAEDKLSAATTDRERIYVIERFLLAQLKEREQDKLVLEAVKRIYRSNGSIKIGELSEQLFISQRPFEKRFKKLVGTTPKKFASLVRFHTVLDQLNSPKTLADICYVNHFFDQAHFIHDFKAFSGETPEYFRKKSKTSAHK